MKSIPVEDFVKIADFWVNQAWPLSLSEAESQCLKLGWERFDEGLFRMPYSISNATVRVSVGSEELGVAKISFRLTDVCSEESLERDAFMNDVFVEVVEDLAPLWGKPKMKKLQESHSAHWGLANGSEVDLTNRWKVVSFVLMSPGYAEVDRYLRGRR